MRVSHLKNGLIVACCFVTTNGCAVTSKENRLTLNHLDNVVHESGITHSTTSKIAAAPIAFPIGIAACALDVAVVTPARAAVPAAKDTFTYLWKNPQGSEFRQMMILVPKIIATPAVFVTDWAFRSVFTTSF